MRFSNFFIAILTVLMCSGAFAQQTGSISGFVRDSGGGGLPGATVRVEGPQLPAGQEVITDSAGRFRFLALLPGTYSVSAELAGLGSAARRTIVSVDKDTQLSLVLGATLAETITVTAEAAPVVDMRSSEVNFNFDEEDIRMLPLARSYSGLIQLAPGVAAASAPFTAPSAGGSRQDNTFLLDGVNVTNPLFGYLGVETNALDVKEFNIKRAAFSAEFGRSGGMVTNLITKSGTNELDGSITVEYLPREFIAEDKVGQKSNTDQMTPAFGIGFPILRDRVFGYASGRFFRSETTDRVNLIGPVPDSKTDTNEYHAKLTANPTANHLINIGHREIPTDVEFSGIGSTDTPAVASDFEGENRVSTALWNWTIGSSTLFEVKYLEMAEDGATVARTDLGFQPPFNPNNLPGMGRFFDPTYPRVSGGTGAFVGGAALREERVAYAREEAKIALTQFLDFGNVSHEIKGGFGVERSEEDLLRTANGWSNITLVQNNTRYQATYYPEQPAQLSKAQTYSLYVQDTIAIGTRLVVNVGVLANKDEFIQDIGGKENTFLTFDFGEEIQPRVGVNFNIRETVGDKVYANLARYYNMDQKSSARSLAPQRLFLEDALFDLQGNLISKVPRASTTGKVLDQNMDPTYTDEIVLGYATPLGSKWGLDVFWMYRDTDDFIEDMPRILPASSFWVTNLDAAERRYYAVIIDVSRRFSDRWSANVNYTHSRLYGNIDFDYSFANALFNTSSALQDSPGLFVEEPFRWGAMAQDRPHVFKAFGGYEVIPNFTLGGFLRIQSGTPWQAAGRDWDNGFRRYLEPAGSHRNPTWTNFDLLASYRLPLGQFGVSLEARILNVFDDQETLRTDDIPWNDGRIRLSGPPWLEQGMTQPNANFGKSIQDASPRRIVAMVKIDF
jgi:hypothetical protein